MSDFIPMVDRVSEFAKGQEEKLVKFVSVAEKLAQELSAPNENLESLIAGLKKEVESVRAFKNEHQKLPVEMEDLKQASGSLPSSSTIAEKSVERQKRPRNESSAEDEMMRPMGVQLVQELDSFEAVVKNLKNRQARFLDEFSEASKQRLKRGGS
ncbi:PREDICTED: uncharacterized protein LOC101310353 [Fragaria vesca subsp. vesca]|uniref:uncharacterized protein LOC101310353 n=1 Tax=Fragaria vesca subsp. vesca TaxID=101020 RepID=UPI0002C36C01|nr:PREDICTED: uncharacterized protein LOC101310353 [Fragaria vesca subsp. vesca]